MYMLSGGDSTSRHTLQAPYVRFLHASDTRRGWGIFLAKDGQTNLTSVFVPFSIYNHNLVQICSDHRKYLDKLIQTLRLKTRTKTKEKRNKKFYMRILMNKESTEIGTGKDMYNGDCLYSYIINCLNIALDDISTVSNGRLFHLSYG